MRDKLKTMLLSVGLAVSLMGCGGLNCPINAPDCCSNAVFGCGPFELPSGCSCSDYGYMATASGISAGKRTQALGNAWSGLLTQHSSSCFGFPQRIRGNLQMVTSAKRVKIAVPGYGVLRGQRRNSYYLASGTYGLSGSCSGRVNLRLTPAKARKAYVATDISYRCKGRDICTAEYRGTLRSKF